MDLCRPVSAIEGRSHLCSAARWQINVPRPKLLTYNGRSAFLYADQSAWNSLINYHKDSSLTLVMIKRSLKTFLFSKYYHIECIKDVCILVRYTNFPFTFKLHNLILQSLNAAKMGQIACMLFQLF